MKPLLGGVCAASHIMWHEICVHSKEKYCITLTRKTYCIYLVLQAMLYGIIFVNILLSAQNLLRHYNI